MSDLPGPGSPADLLGLRLARTARGQQEISARQLPLARPARNLLLIIDPGRTTGEWLALVRGCTEDDLYQLLTNGLVAAVVASGEAPASSASVTQSTTQTTTQSATQSTTQSATQSAAKSSAPPAEPGPPATEGIPVATARMSLADALQMQSYRLLYDRMTAEARPQLGLIKGYKLILDIERCSGPEAIRALALQFVETVRGVHGDTRARALAQRLADPP